MTGFRYVSQRRRPRSWYSSGGKKPEIVTYCSWAGTRELLGVILFLALELAFVVLLQVRQAGATQVMNAFISLKDSPFEMKCLLALSSEVELCRERGKTTLSTGNLEPFYFL